MARRSIRKGPVKVAQRHRSERYPEKPFPSNDGRTPTTDFPPDYMFSNGTTCFTCRRRCHGRCVRHCDPTKRGIGGEMYRWFQALPLISRPPSFLLQLSWQAASVKHWRRTEPPRPRRYTEFWRFLFFEKGRDWLGCRKETQPTISSNVLSSISGSMLTIPPETRCENGNPALRRRPANAETSFTSLSHTAPSAQAVSTRRVGGWERLCWEATRWLAGFCLEA